MMKIDYREGLLFANVEFCYKGRKKNIDNVVIDTGASKTIISPDAVEDIGIYAESGDKIVILKGVGGSEHYSFVKTIDSLRIGSFLINSIEIDFGIIDLEGKINGLLGLMCS